MWDLNEDEEAVEGRKRQTEEVRGDARIMELRGLWEVWSVYGMAIVKLRM